MPVITIHGIPTKYGEQNEQKLIEIEKELREQVASVPKLELKPEYVTVYFVPDLLPKGLGEEIILFIDLYRKQERTPEVLEVMSIRCAFTMRKYFATASIECFPRLLEEERCATLPRREILGDDGSPSCPICASPTRRIDDGTAYKCVNCHEVRSCTGN